MKPDRLDQTCQFYIEKLCVEIDSRSVGSQGNREATRFFKDTISGFGWDTRVREFPAIDWFDGGASLLAGGHRFKVFASPYANGCQVEAELVSAASFAELEGLEITGKVVLLHGEIACEQLMPKNFVFYNPEEHQRIIAALEKGQPAAIISATGRNASLAGGVYPFPLLEDGDFDIPSVYMTEEEGKRLLQFTGETARLISKGMRIPSSGSNVSAVKGSPAGGRIVVTAHIDAKKGTPGAIDNATGVTVLLILAELLQDYAGSRQVEIVAFNGEDYYAVPGQMLYLQDNQGRFDEILVNINIDGAGYREGKSAFSFYGLPAEMEKKIKEIMGGFEGITEGAQWVQGDHSMFIQSGRPAVAVTSDWFSQNIDSQEITHTPRDHPGIVDCDRVVEIARALDQIIRFL